MDRKKRFLTGFTLIELIIAVVISGIAILSIGSLLILSWKDWKAGKEIADLQTDLDQASYLIKGILEEAKEESITGGSRIQVSYGSDWQKEFYGEGNNLIYKNDKTGETEIIINTLKSITFENTGISSVTVNLAVENGAKELDNSFVVYFRNIAGG